MVMTRTIGLALASLLAVFSWPTKAAKLSLILEPATEYQNFLPQAVDRKFFRPVHPESHSLGCFESTCSGAFAADLSQHDTIHITFRTEKELFIRPDAYDPRVRVAFSARTENCTDGKLLISKKIKASRVAIIGNYTQELYANLKTKESFVEITSCSIASNLEFIAPDEASVFEGNVTAFFWKVALDNPAFKLLSNQTYVYDTDQPMWVQIPVAPTPAPTTVPTLSPSSTPSAIPTKAPADPLLSKEEPESDAGTASGDGTSLTMSAKSVYGMCVLVAMLLTS